MGCEFFYIGYTHARIGQARMGFRQPYFNNSDGALGAALLLTRYFPSRANDSARAISAEVNNRGSRPAMFFEQPAWLVHLFS